MYFNIFAHSLNIFDIIKVDPENFILRFNKKNSLLLFTSSSFDDEYQSMI